MEKTENSVKTCKKTGNGTKETAAVRKMTLRFPEEAMRQAESWAQLHQVSMNDWITDAVYLKLSHENGHYNVPDLMTARMNQMLAGQEANTRQLQNVENLVMQLFQTILSIENGEDPGF